MGPGGKCSKERNVLRTEKRGCVNAKLESWVGLRLVAKNQSEAMVLGQEQHERRGKTD